MAPIATPTIMNTAAAQEPEPPSNCEVCSDVGTFGKGGELATYTDTGRRGRGGAGMAGLFEGLENNQWAYGGSGGSAMSHFRNRSLVSRRHARGDGLVVIRT